MGPATLIGALRLIEAALFVETFGGGFDENDCALAAFGTEIQMAIRVGNRAFVQPFLGPDAIAAFEFLARPALAVGVAIEVLAEANDAAVMVHHHFVHVNLVGREFVTRPGYFK